MTPTEDVSQELAKPKELKVAVPVDLYLKLHQHKILSGTRLSDVVTQALEEYLDTEFGPKGTPE